MKVLQHGFFQGFGLLQMESFLRVKKDDIILFFFYFIRRPFYFTNSIATNSGQKRALHFIACYLSWMKKGSKSGVSSHELISIPGIYQVGYHGL